MHYITMIKL